MIRFNPTGHLDIATDPSDLPEEVQGKSAVSGAMTRCTNLHLDQAGMAITRLGSRTLNATAIDTSPHLLIEQAGIRYCFAGSSIYRDETSIASSLTDAMWSAILYNAYNVTTQAVFALNGTDRKRIEGTSVYEWGIAAPTAAPTATREIDYSVCLDWEKDTQLALFDCQQITTEEGNYACLHEWEVATVAGDESDFADSYAYIYSYWWERGYGSEQNQKYLVKVTYCRKSGDVLECESNPSPLVETNAASGIRIDWTASTDTQVTHVRVYRTLADMGDYYYDQEVATGTTHAILTKRDEELGTELAVNHDRPPTGSFVIPPAFDGTCFIIDDNRLYFSLPKQPEYWPAAYYVEVGPPQHELMAGAYLGGQLYVASQVEIHLVQGTAATSFFPLPMRAKTGTQSVQCFEPVKGHGIFHLGPDGIYLFNGSTDELLTEARFAPLFRGETVGSIPGIRKDYLSRCWIRHWRNKVYFGYPSSGYPDNVLVLNLATGKIVHHQYSATFRTTCVDAENNRLLAASTDGYIWQIEHPYWPLDEDTAISWDIESKQFGALRKYFPRYARYDVELDSAFNVTGEATGYVHVDEVSTQTHSSLVSRNTRKRLIATCTGDRLSVRITGTGPVKIHTAEIE